MDIFTDAALAFIQQNRTRPFFVYLSANLIHTPLQGPDKLVAPARTRVCRARRAQ
jgi:hypothetical protein